MKVTYQADLYASEKVTGRYVLRQRKGVYRVYETATGTGRFADKPGHGPTLREYDCDGSEIPAEVIARCDASLSTELWEHITP